MYIALVFIFWVAFQVTYAQAMRRNHLERIAKAKKG